MKTHFIFYLLIFPCLLFFTSCEGEQGLPGPQGIDGLDGPQGVPGEDGTDGQDGNANIRLVNLEVELENFFQDIDHEVWGVNASAYGAPYIARNELVTVFVYMNVDNGYFEWVALPFNWYYSGGSAYNHFLYSVDNDSGELYFYIRNSQGIQPFSNMSGTLSYKVFIASADGRPANVDWDDYDAVKEAYLSQEP